MFLKRIATILALASSLTTVLRAQVANQQWLIESIEGRWEVQEEGKKPRPMSEKFEVLTPACQIRCVAMPCKLNYSTETANGVAVKPMPLPTKLKLNRFFPVPVPTEPPVVKLAAEIQELVGKVGIRSGAAKESPACTGELPLIAPACGETIDVDDFRLVWISRRTEAGKAFTLLVGGADSSERRRWNTLRADVGEFREQTLQSYLSSLQLPDRATDVTIRVMRTESLYAERLVHLPSRSDEEQHRKKLAVISLMPPLAGRIARMEQLLKMGMWSNAGDLSRKLIEDTPDSVEIQKYALVGLCASGFASEIAKVRGLLSDAGVTGFCQEERTGR